MFRIIGTRTQYIEFGNVKINLSKLENLQLVVRKTTADYLYKIPINEGITPDFYNLLLEVFETEKINQESVAKLSNKRRIIFKFIIQESKISKFNNYSNLHIKNDFYFVGTTERYKLQIGIIELIENNCLSTNQFLINHLSNEFVQLLLELIENNGNIDDLKIRTLSIEEQVKFDFVNLRFFHFENVDRVILDGNQYDMRRYANEPSFRGVARIRRPEDDYDYCPYSGRAFNPAIDNV